MKYYYKRKYWVAWFEVNFSKLLGLPAFEYGWWLARLKKIRKGDIK
jgi:hypothetical protein